MEASINLHGDIKRFYTYRSGSINHLTLVIEDRESADSTMLASKVKKYLESQGYRMDNHICWETTSGVCYGYSDHKLYVGSSITEGRW